ncbi:MAG: metallophosphoesterase [FCB group bacterium]|nr:metallophosphoesterase [FCB group bacterium]
MSRVLVIGDIHEPVSHPKYLQFCQDLYEAWDCNTVVFIGDLLDMHAISFHAAHPDCPGPSDEYELAYADVQKWCEAFPTAWLTIGNHDARPMRLAESVNIPAKYMRNYAEVWDTPRWKWVQDVTIDGVYYYHGTGCTGKTPALNAATARMTSTVIGHCHSKSGVGWGAGPTARIFGMDVGCGIDGAAMNFAYGKHLLKKPILSAGVVLDGVPYHEIMPCGPKEKYSKAARISIKGVPIWAE